MKTIRRVWIIEKDYGTAKKSRWFPLAGVEAWRGRRLATTDLKSWQEFDPAQFRVRCYIPRDEK